MTTPDTKAERDRAVRVLCDKLRAAVETGQPGELEAGVTAIYADGYTSGYVRGRTDERTGAPDPFALPPIEATLN